jgi:hypothetical protein
MAALNSIECNLEYLLDEVIDKNKELKFFLTVRAQFDLDDKYSRDFLTKYFLSKLVFDKDIYNRLTIIDSGIPDEIMDKLKIFNPEPVIDYDDDVIVKFGMWKRYDGKISDPVNVIDLYDWGLDVMPEAEVSAIIMSYDVITTKKNDITIM